MALQPAAQRPGCQTPRWPLRLVAAFRQLRVMVALAHPGRSRTSEKPIQVGWNSPFTDASHRMSSLIHTEAVPG